MNNRTLVVTLVSILGVLALACTAGVVGVAWYLSHRSEAGPAAATDEAIPGLIDYRTTHPDWLQRTHVDPSVQVEYPMKPAAGGNHHPVWMRCLGDVYPSPVDEGSAVHSLEHGAVWVTYRPGLAPASIEALAKRVRDHDYMFMSPYEGQSTAVSLQAWGYQLQLDSAKDARIDAFIRKYRQTASMEAGVPCSNGTTSASPSSPS
ncbi:DUF3105 domain-containing protein [Dactylosporangium sp. NPDC051485]|uniref:DUF3105 domain-containing protein n=1 Tax=Dactylosporangium sp. NPDC051485 TaxID=3154846 RepID=UPI00343FB6D6